MGVQGLWQLIDPIGKTVNLESLQNKVLAVDASILLHQSIHGFRDGQGNPLPNAHLLGFFHRISKLLFYNIKPVFVFDGAVPTLKRQTMTARRERQENAVKDSDKVRRQVLTKYLQSKAVKEVLNSQAKTSVKKTPEKALKLASTGFESTDLFELPPLPPQLDSETITDEDEDSAAVDDFQFAAVESRYQDFNNIDFDSDDFKSLPLEIQHEFLVELRERSKLRSWFRDRALPKEAEKIGSHQIQQLITRRKIRKRLDDVRKELDVNFTGNIVSGMGENELGSLQEDRFSVARRIVSEDFAHYLLFKNVQGKSNKPQKEVETLDGEFQNDSEVLKSEDVNEEDKGKLKYPFMLSDDDDENVKDEVQFDAAANEATIAKWLLQPDDLLRNVDDIEEKSSEKLKETLTEKVKEISTEKVNELSTEKPKAISSKSENMFDNEISRANTIAKSQPLVLKEVINKTEPVEVSLDSNFPNANRSNVQENKNFNIIEVLQKEFEESENSDEDFLEVTVDVNKAVEDELFPLDIFEIDKKESSVKDKTNNVPEIAIIEEKNIESLVELETNYMVNEFISSLPENNENLQLITEELDSNIDVLLKEQGRQERIAATITDQMYLEGQELLRQFGVPFVVSPAEAEAQCATLEQLGLTEGTITDDSDVWLFGANRVYKNFFEKNRDPLFFSNSDIYNRFHLDRSRLIAIAFLTGSDYTEGVKGIGVVKALELLGEFSESVDGFKCLQTFRLWWDKAQKQKVAPSETKVKQFLRKIELKENFPCDIVLKAYMEPLVDSSAEPFSWSTPDLDSLRQFANKKLSWSREKVDSMLLPIMKRLATANREKQLQLTQLGFTLTNRDVGSVCHPSKRLVRAINKVRNRSKDTEEEPKCSEKNTTRKKSAISNRQPSEKIGRRGKSTRQKISNLSVTAHSSKDLELSESSDSFEETNDETPNKRKR